MDFSNTTKMYNCLNIIIVNHRNRFVFVKNIDLSKEKENK